MKRVHVAHFTNTYYPVISGVVRSVSTFRQGLTELGHNVFIFAQQSSDYEDTEPFIFRYRSLDLPMLHDFPVTIPISRFVDKLLPALKLDALHSHHPFLLGQTAAKKAEELDRPLVFTFHTRYREYSHYVNLNQTLVKEAIDRWVGEYMQKCHHIVTPSQSIKDMLGQEYGVTGQVSVVPTGIDLEPYQSADGQAIRRKEGWGQQTILISVGRLAKEKNWRTLLQAMAQVTPEHNNVKLVIIGDGDERKALKEYARQLGVNQAVEFVGQIPFEQMPAYLSAADIFCFASVTETQGLVSMEALAAGLPVVAVDASGTRDVVEDGEQGLLTENDGEALGRAIVRLLENDELRERFQTAAKEKAKSLEMKEQAKKLLDVYAQAQEDQRAERFVPVDEDKQVFNLIDDEQWSRLLGLE